MCRNSFISKSSFEISIGFSLKPCCLLFVVWNIGSNWKHVEGYTEGQTATCSNKFGNTYCAFAHPIDVHLACRGIQGWPKLHIEVYAVNALNQCWPVG